MTTKNEKTLQDKYGVRPTHRLGLITNMSPESSNEYDRLINQQIQSRLGGLHSAEVVSVGHNFAAIAGLMDMGQWVEIEVLLDNDLRMFRSAGVRAVAVCSNTMHKVLEPLCDNLKMPLIHIGDATAAGILRRGSKRVGLLGTIETMTSDFLINHLQRSGAEIVIPPEKYHGDINSIIFEELCRGEFRQQSRDFMTSIIQTMRRDSKIDGVVLGCTEIPLLITPKAQRNFCNLQCDGKPFAFYDSTMLHIDAIAHFCCTGQLLQISNS